MESLSVDDAAPYYELGLNLLRNVEAENGNILVSPISLARPLAVLATGAKGETLNQIEGVLGTTASGMTDSQLKALADSWNGDGDTFTLADSLWLNRTFRPREQFIASAEEDFGAEVFDRDFDQATLTEINSWVNEHTKGMIPSILDDISPDAALYVIDACAFDGQWEEPYEESQVRPGDFTTVDGATQQVDLMWEDDAPGYLEDDWCTGFMKSYGDDRFKFVGLLPKEGSTVADLVGTIHGEQLADLVRMGGSGEATTALPKFDGEYTMTLNDALQRLGMTDAFDPDRADFSGIAEDPSAGMPYIGKVLQKTFVEVSEAGTKAAAATSVEIETTALAPEGEAREVVLDRPFLYLIVDAEANAPLFMGTVGSIG